MLTTLRVEVAINVVLTPPKPIHRDPMAQGFHLTPYFRIPLLDPCLDMGLLLAIGGAVEPAAKTMQLSAKLKRAIREAGLTCVDPE
jgi:hypothetical protein